uniref:Uncharacterized protein n=1 Tax=Aegilops tauschii subsp. strangulata TaxID=200361 RepID=A0A453QMF8_AEGTS
NISFLDHHMTHYLQLSNKIIRFWNLPVGTELLVRSLCRSFSLLLTKNLPTGFVFPELLFG